MCYTLFPSILDIIISRFRLGLPTGVLFSHSINTAYFSPFEKNSLVFKTFNKLQNRAHES